MHLVINSEADWYAAPRRALMGDCGCGCSGSCGNPTRKDGLGFMGDAAGLTPEAAVQQAMQGESSPDFQRSGWLSSAAQQVAAGQFDIASFSTSCASQPAPNLNLLSTVGGLSLSAAGVGTGIALATHAIAATTAAALGVATMGAGLVISVIGMIFSHHHAAVRQEQQLGCAAIAAANNSIAVLDQAMQGGHTTAADASAGLDALVSQFSSYVSPSVKHGPCNANCEMIVLLKAMVLYRKYLYGAMAAAATSSAIAAMPATQTVPGGGGTLVPMNTASSASQTTTGTQVDLRTGAVVHPAPTTGTPSWLPIAAAIAAAFILFNRS